MKKGSFIAMMIQSKEVGQKIQSRLDYQMVLRGSIAAANRRTGVHRSCDQPADSRIFVNTFSGKRKNSTEAGFLSGAEWIRLDWHTSHRLTDFENTFSGKRKNPTEAGFLSGAEWIDRTGVPAIDSRIFKNTFSRKRKNPTEAGFLSGAEWIRTTDSRIFSPMLYQLSYSTKIWVGKSRNFFEKAKYKSNFIAGIF